jgi:hypothetical protein
LLLLLEIKAETKEEEGIERINGRATAQYTDTNLVIFPYCSAHVL